MIFVHLNNCFLFQILTLRNVNPVPLRSFRLRNGRVAKDSKTYIYLLKKRLRTGKQLSHYLHNDNQKKFPVPDAVPQLSSTNSHCSMSFIFSFSRYVYNIKILGCVLIRGCDYPSYVWNRQNFLHLKSVVKGEPGASQDTRTRRAPLKVPLVRLSPLQPRWARQLP